MKTTTWLKGILFALVAAIAGCTGSNSKGQGPNLTNAEKQAGPALWITTANGSQLLQKQQGAYPFGSAGANTGPVITVDEKQPFQQVDGFGYTLTGGSATLISQLNSSEKAALLKELFGNNTGSIGVSYLRVSIGASDLDPAVFSYSDLPEGQTDELLKGFSLSKDSVHLVPLLQQILAINPRIKILGSPWSAPVWMKDNNKSMGGGLLPRYYPVYANYFVKYIQAMKSNGITIDAITLQNEPQHGGNNPSMVMSAVEQAAFVKTSLGPAFKAAGITTKIIVWDHNCDHPEYPITVLDDPAAKAFIDGTAFHLYNGDISALSEVKKAHPDKNLYFTEQWTGAKGTFSGDLMWHIKNVIIGSMRNWSRVALEWNLANDPEFNPHTPGGCTECKGAITVGKTLERNVAYYIIAQASKFVPAGSVRIESTLLPNLPNVAFLTPGGQKVLLLLNEENKATTININHNGKTAAITLPAQSAGTFTW